ncbi:MAG: glycine cleavage system protein GcvH [Cytophagales bacterium]|nr:glycine cleavage system protein GcvH [Cytophagales bacterium]
MNIPNKLKYSKDHIWVRVEGDTATVGITDFAQSELGDVVYVDIEKKEGEKEKQNAILGSVESVKTVSDLFMPVTGEVTEINTQMNDEPALINSDPYGKGWIIKVKIKDQEEVKNLLSSEEYKKVIAE